MAKTKLNPYLTFNGNTKAAMAFYQSVFGGELKSSTFGEMGGDMPVPEGYADKIMHSELLSDELTIMASEGMPGRPVKFGDNVSLSLSGSDKEQLTGYFEALAAGGEVTMPLAPQVWGDTFGMLTDQFGVLWLVNITKEG